MMPASDQGLQDNRYTLIPRSLIFLINDKQLLLLKGAAHKRLWANRYNGIGGHIESNEDALSGARRELAEETGLAGIDMHLCGLVTIDTGEQTGVGIFVFRAEFPGERPVEAELQASSEGSLEWIPFDQLSGLPLVEDLPILLPRVLAWHPGQEPFFAHSFYGANGHLVISFANP